MSNFGLIGLLFIFIFGCAEDATTKKKASNNNNNQNQYPYQQGQHYDPNGQNQQQQPGPGNNNIQYGNAGGECGAKTFTKTLTAAVQKTILIFVNVSGNGRLDVANKPDALELDLDITNVNVNIEASKPQVMNELNKVKGKRTFRKVADADLSNLKNQGQSWSAANCLLGFAREQVFPYGDKTVTVEYSPALPFAPYPDKVANSNALDNGLSFSGITGKITNISGGSIEGFNVGDSFNGSVNISKSGSTYKVSYNFGGFSALEKLGLFNYAAYTYNSGDISSVEVEAGILQGADNIKITFD